jgi:UDP-N-acetylglucosamine 3-dehydrogenase
MTKKLRIGVIGCGAIAKHLHVPDYAAAPEAELVALCDIVKGKAEDLARKFAPSAKVYTDYKALLKDGNVDAVSVCLPNILHGPVTMAAAKAGCHVLVEKPMATSLDEAKAMIAAAKKAGVLLMVNQSQRRFPSHVKAKEVMDSGIMGKVLQVTAVFGHEGPEFWSPTGKWFFQKKQARFGAMADLGVHKADLVRHITGKEIAEVGAFYGTLEKKNTDVEDNFAAALKFVDGTLGTLMSSWTVKGMEANYLILHCANGTLAVNLYPDKPLVAHMVKPACEIVFPMPPAPTNADAGWGIDIGGAFCRAVMGLEKPYCTGEEGMKSLAVILAAEKAAQTGKTVKIKI